MSLEMQYLVEAETKRDAMQSRLDGCYPEFPPKSWIQEWSRLEALVQRLRAELGLS